MKIREIKRISENKKGISEMVSYVLLIVIAIGISTGVYAWLKGYLPSATPKETCNPDVSLVLEDYNCSAIDNLTTLTLKNQGYFNIDGFFIRGANSLDEKVLPVIPLRCDSSLNCLINGKYDFINAPLKPQEGKKISFYYNDSKPLKRIQIQPYVKPTKGSGLLLCNNIIDLNLEGCD